MPRRQPTQLLSMPLYESLYGPGSRGCPPAPGGRNIDPYVACDADRNRILNGPGHWGCAEGSESAGGWVAGGLVAAVEVNRWVAEGGESGDVGGLGW